MLRFSYNGQTGYSDLRFFHVGVETVNRPSCSLTPACPFSTSSLLTSFPVKILISICLSVSELLRSRWNLCGGNLAFKQGACGHSGTAFFMSETEHACSRLCHPLFSRQKIPKNPQPRSFYLTDSANIHPKCLSTSTAACQTSSIATRCPV